MKFMVFESDVVSVFQFMTPGDHRDDAKALNILYLMPT